MVEERKYEVLIGEGAENLIPDINDKESLFSYVVLENLEFSEVMYLLELTRKQTYRPLITIREMGGDE